MLDFYFVVPKYRFTMESKSVTHTCLGFLEDVLEQLEVNDLQVVHDCLKVLFDSELTRFLNKPDLFILLDLVSKDKTFMSELYNIAFLDLLIDEVCNAKLSYRETQDWQDFYEFINRMSNPDAKKIYAYNVFKMYFPVYRRNCKLCADTPSLRALHTFSSKSINPFSKKDFMREYPKLFLFTLSENKQYLRTDETFQFLVTDSFLKKCLNGAQMNSRKEECGTSSFSVSHIFL